MSKVRDQAEAAVTAMLQIINQHFADDALCAALVAVLRDELDAVARKTRNEIRLDGE